jgi:catechol 2,3-dioxygenase-like lactoylglutathione lyase family enzyme
MVKLTLAIDVPDLAEGVDFYTRAFGFAVHKLTDGLELSETLGHRRQGLLIGRAGAQLRGIRVETKS